MFLEILQNSQENTCGRVSFLIKLQILAQEFSCESYQISKNTFFTEQLLATASYHYLQKFEILHFWKIDCFAEGPQIDFQCIVKRNKSMLKE